MQQPQEVRRALGADQPAPEVQPVIPDQRAEDVLLLVRLEIAHTSAATGIY